MPRKWLRHAADVAILTLGYRSAAAPLLTDYFVSSPVAGSGNISRSPAGKNIGSRRKLIGTGKLILRSFYVGIASIALARNDSPWIYVVPLAVFATGFLIGFRYFSKRQARQEVSR